MLESDIASDNFSISIYSMNGELLLKDKRKVERGINDFSIDLNQLLSGVYLIQAEIDGICSKVDKLIILK